MKILCLAQCIGRGGMTRVMETLLPALVRRGIELTILGQPINEIGQTLHYPDGAKFVQIRPESGLVMHPYQFDWLVANSQKFVDHARELEKDYDLIWCPVPFFSVGSAFDAIFSKPLVISIPDFAFDHIGMGDILTPLFRMASVRLAHRVDHVIFSSRFQRDWGVSRYRFESNSVIPYSLDFTPALDGTSVHPDLPERYLLALHPMGHKDPITIIRAYAYARSRAGDVCVPPLVFAGLYTDDILDFNKQSADITSVRRMIGDRKLEIGKDFFATGYVAEDAMPDLYRRASAVLVASRSEGDLSGTMNEAIRFRRPLIYSDLPIFRERLSSPDHGLSFPVADDVTMGKAILSVLGDPGMAAVRAERAYQHISKRTIDDVVDEFVEAFTFVIAQKGCHV